MPIGLKSDPIRASKETVLTARDWQSLNVSFAGTSILITGATKIKYGIKQNTQLNYGIGGKPISKGYGNIEYSGELTLTIAQLEQIMDEITTWADANVIPLNFVPFDITVTWTDRNTGGLRTDEIYNCTIDNYEKSLGVGDMETYVDLILNPTSIKFGGK